MIYFIKKNWFKISLLLILIIGIYVYLNINNLNKNSIIIKDNETFLKTATSVSLEDDCKRDSNQYFNSFIKDSINVPGSSYENLIIKTHWNTKINSCFMYFSYDFYPHTNPEKEILLKYSYFYEIKKEIKNISDSKIETWNSLILGSSINSSYGIGNNNVDFNKYNNYILERMETNNL